VARGLITVNGSKFAPQQALTRAELAHALAVITDLATK